MADYCAYCGISNIAIRGNDDVYVLPLIHSNKLKSSNTIEYIPAMLPILGKYDYVGGIEKIVIDDNVTLIQNYFNTSIDNVVEKFMYGGNDDYNYNADNVDDRIKELHNYDFMFILKSVYDEFKKDLFPQRYNKDYLGGISDIDKIMSMIGYENDTEANTDFDISVVGGEIIVNVDEEVRERIKKLGYKYVHRDNGDAVYEKYKILRDINGNVRNDLKNTIKSLVNGRNKYECSELLTIKEKMELYFDLFGNPYVRLCSIFTNIENENQKEIDESYDKRVLEGNFNNRSIINEYLSLDNVDKFADRIAHLYNIHTNIGFIGKTLTPYNPYAINGSIDKKEQLKIFNIFLDIIKKAP